MLKHCYGSVNSLPLAKNDQPLPPSRVRGGGGAPTRHLPLRLPACPSAGRDRMAPLSDHLPGGDRSFTHTVGA